MLSAAAPPVRRLFTTARRIEDTVRAAARAAFYDNGVLRTRGRTGMLVYVSLFERRVELVPDVGIDQAALGAEWTEAKARLAVAVRRTDVDTFLTTIAAMGPLLGRALPRADDDVNELPDEVVA